MAFEQSALTIEKLHRDHGDGIRRYLARLVGLTDAEDLARDVFEKAAFVCFRGFGCAGRRRRTSGELSELQHEVESLREDVRKLQRQPS